MDKSDKALDGLRASYLKMLIQQLQFNVKETAGNVSVDQHIIVHCGLSIEEDCFNKYNPHCACSSSGYTREITVARLKIDRFTAAKKLYPAILDILGNDNKTDALNANGTSIVSLFF